MTLEIFANRSRQPARLPDSLALSPGCGGMPKTIGREHTNLLSRTRESRDRGFMPICIVKRGIGATQNIGMVGQASPFAVSRWMWNGSAS